jgi:hypothetical protein
MGDKLTTEDLIGRRVPTEDSEPRADFSDAAPGRGDVEADGAEAPQAPGTTTATADAADERLLGSEDTTRWHQVQVAFVDEPRSAVEQADNLVAELMRQLAETFADERGRLEAAWTAGEDVDTEQLRVALTRYRSFFQRLLAT